MSLDIYLVKTTQHTVHEQNITHNLGKMAEAAGIYKALWRPEEIPITKASQLAALLGPAIKDMAARPEDYKQFDAANGWGTYHDFMPWLNQLHKACLENPDALLEVSR